MEKMNEMKTKVFKKRVLKVAPYALATIPAVGAVVKYIDFANQYLAAQTMIRNGAIINLEHNLTQQYFHNLCEYFNSFESGNKETIDSAFDKVYGFFTDEYQAELEILGPDARAEFEKQVHNIENNALEATAQELNMSSEDVLSVYLGGIKNSDNFDAVQDAYMANVYKEVAVADSNFASSEYMQDLMNTCPTVGEYIDVVDQANGSLGVGVALTAVSAGTFAVAKTIFDKKAKKLENEIADLQAANAKFENKEKEEEIEL